MYHESKSLGVQEEKLNLIPWGIETELFQPVPNDCILTRRKFGIDQNSKVVLSPRGVANIYNVDIIVEAINKIVSYFPKVYLVLLNYNTSAEYISKLEEMIASYNLQKHILWLPPQKIADMPQLYRMADVMVSIPSSEGFGFTVYEAMASGCPTIISDLPVFEGELESGTHTIKVPVRSVDHTSWALSNLLTHETLRLNIRQNALEICQTKDAATRVERTKILYQTVIAKFQK
jgi:glycosyltransferase involved in cell wall biosynthesis